MPTPSFLRRPAVLLALALCAVAAIVSVLGRLGTSPRGASSAKALDSGGGSENFPALSPDGRRLAFSAQRGVRIRTYDPKTGEANPTGKMEGYQIFVRGLAGGAPVQLTSGEANQFGPAWSPDGANLAFLKVEESGAACMTLASDGGQQQKVADCAVPDAGHMEPAVTWTAGGKSLVITAPGSGKQPPYLALVSAQGGAPKRITTPPDEGAGDSTPAVSPDGRLLAFVRGSTSEGSDESRGADIFICNLDGGGLRRVTFDDRPVHGIAWTPDGQELIYASHRGPKSGLWRVGLSGTSPKALTVAGRTPRYPTLARTGGRLAYSETPSLAAIWRAPLLDGSMEKAAALIRSAGRESAPSYSPDGARISAISDQTGSDEIWVSDANGGNRVQLTHLNGASRVGRPRWSPDGKTITFEMRGQGMPEIMAIPAAGGTPKRLLDAAFGAVLSRDGKSIYYEMGQIWKAAADGSNRRRLSHDGGSQVEESVDGKTLYYRRWNSLMRVDAEGGEEKEIFDTGRDSVTNGPQVRGKGIYFTQYDRHENFPVLSRWDPESHKATEMLRLNGAQAYGVSVSPDEKYVLFVVTEDKATLRLAEEFK
jgi:Tol biopolymer transport system component